MECKRLFSIWITYYSRACRSPKNPWSSTIACVNQYLCDNIASVNPEQNTKNVVRFFIKLNILILKEWLSSRIYNFTNIVSLLWNFLVWQLLKKIFFLKGKKFCPQCHRGNLVPHGIQRPPKALTSVYPINTSFNCVCAEPAGKSLGSQEAWTLMEPWFRISLL